MEYAFGIMKAILTSFILLAGIFGALVHAGTPANVLLVLAKRDNMLLIVHPSNLKVLARVPVGNDPHEVIASTDGKTAYVSNYGSGAYNTLAVVDLVAQKALPSIDLGPLRGPHGLTFVGGKTWFTAAVSYTHLKIDWHEKMLRGIKERFPQVHLHCYSASEIIAIAEYSSLSIRDTILRLRDAGLDSIPGGGAEILDDEVRYKIARLKCLTGDWINVHRTAHQIGMRTTATMMFGVGENYENRVNHFQQLYDLQEETGGFTAFIPWSFQPQNTALGGRHWDEATAVEYLKVLAISRLYLSNFLNVQSSWVTQGLKVCQMGLRFGGNDVGSVMLEENVVRAAGVTNCTTEEELRRIIRDAGFRPAQRDTLYRQYFLN